MLAKRYHGHYLGPGGPTPWGLPFEYLDRTINVARPMPKGTAYLDSN